MLTFNEHFLLAEASRSGYSDEHALAGLWNHAVNHKDSAKLLSNPDHLHTEIEKAKKDKNHPLNFANAQHGFTGGKKPEHTDAYYKELHHAADAVHGLANHPSFKQAVKQKYKARVTGAEAGKLSDTWKKSGAKNTTSKADVVFQHPSNPEGKNIPVSLKKGDSQLMSAEANELHATYSHAVAEHAKVNQKFTPQHQKKVMDRIKKVADNLNAMKNTNDKDEQRRLRDEAQDHINAIHKEHPGLLSHVAHEAATGHGKFGHGQTGTARVLVTTVAGKPPHVHDTETQHHPIEIGVPRVALPKGKTASGQSRPGNVKLDYKAK